MTQEQITRIDEYLQENRLFAEVSPATLSRRSKTVEVHIQWGDWKHDHLRCTYLMKKIGYVETSEVVTEEDGSDCYSAIHYYKEIAG